jgi:hypothetical protein
MLVCLLLIDRRFNGVDYWDEWDKRSQWEEGGRA